MLSKSLCKFWVVTVFFIFGCATYQGQVQESRILLEAGQKTEALARLQKLADQEGRDQLVHVLDYATALHIHGDFEKSVEYFLRADKLVEENDYFSISNNVVATLGSEEMIQYKGDSFEQLMIPLYLAFNFIMLGDFEKTQVSLRRVNDRINLFRQKGRENYEFNPFAYYLQALVWEAAGDFDNAYIALTKARDLVPSTNPFLEEDLQRLELKSGRKPGGKRGSKEPHDGELIVIFQQGWGPRKQMSPVDRRFPVLTPTFNRTQGVRVTVESFKSVDSGKNDSNLETQNVDAGLNAEGKSSQVPLDGNSGSVSERSQMVYDLGGTAIRTLQADYGWLVARKVGGIVVKEIVADQIRQKNEALGLVTWLALHLSDRADLRQWSFLPNTLQIAKIRVPEHFFSETLASGGSGSTAESSKGKAGNPVLTRILKKPVKVKVSIQGVDGSGQSTSESWAQEVEIVPGKRKFLTWRSLN